MQDAYGYCEGLVRETDRDRYLASLFLPERDRRHAYAIYAFNVEIASVRERAGQAMAGEIRLQWWRDALSGTGAADVGGNPVAKALLDTIKRHELSLPVLEGLIEARAFDLYEDPMTSIGAFNAYLRATASSLFELVAGLLHKNNALVRDVAFHAGLAYGITGLLRAFPLHASRGQIYLPGDVLAGHAVQDKEILSGRATSNLLAAFAELRGIARAHRLAATEAMQSLARSTKPAFLPVALIEPYLKRMESADYDPFRTPIEIPQWRRQWTLWRAARHGL